VNPRTVVIVNSGSPVLMPWRDDVAAVLLGWFGGQEFGDAIADILLGAAEPGGRLPTSWPATLEDVPVRDVTPVDGRLTYAEGIHVGYRAWLRAGVAPAYPFGHGLGYTTWSFDEIAVADAASGANPGDAVVQVTVTNTGARAGKQVVQLYASREDSAIERPVRWLVGFGVVRAGAGETVTVDIPVDARRFAHWEGGWELEPGAFTLRAGASVDDLALETSVTPAADAAEVLA
jgi:beta-glucosidase